MYNLVTVLGHTAGGKTRFAACLASQAGGEIISADSRQVYRRMDLGTGKDYADYLVEGIAIPVHLLDLLEPGYEYNVYEYQLHQHAQYCITHYEQPISYDLQA